LNWQNSQLVIEEKKGENDYRKLSIIGTTEFALKPKPRVFTTTPALQHGLKSKISK